MNKREHNQASRKARLIWEKIGHFTDTPCPLCGQPGSIYIYKYDALLALIVMNGSKKLVLILPARFVLADRILHMKYIGEKGSLIRIIRQRRNSDGIIIFIKKTGG